MSARVVPFPAARIVRPGVVQPAAERDVFIDHLLHLLARHAAENRTLRAALTRPAAGPPL